MRGYIVKSTGIWKTTFKTWRLSKRSGEIIFERLIILIYVDGHNTYNGVPPERNGTMDTMQQSVTMMHCSLNDLTKLILIGSFLDYNIIIIHMENL